MTSRFDIEGLALLPLPADIMDLALLYMLLLNLINQGSYKYL